MVYDDYADIGIFAKQMEVDAPGIEGRAHQMVGRRCPRHEKGD